MIEQKRAFFSRGYLIYNILYKYQMTGGIDCSMPELNQNTKYFETILYEYRNNEITIKNMEALLVKDLPKCG